MFAHVFQKHATIFSFVFLALFFTNTLVWTSPLLGGVLLVAFVVGFGKIAGHGLGEAGTSAWWLGAWWVLSIVMLAGSIAYYLDAITAPVVHGIIIAIPPIAWWMGRHRVWSFREWIRGWNKPTHVVPSFVFGAVILCVLAVILFGHILLSSATTDAIRSPWGVVPGGAFVALTLAALLAASLALRGRESVLVLPIFSILLLATLSVNLAIFPLGSGFDPYIHQATESHIAQFGTITPKPLYYIGQYALVLTLHHGFSLPIELADRLLVPVLTAFFLPSAWVAAATCFTNGRRRARALLPLLFLLPLSSFVTTTPQGLGNLWLLLLILASVPYLAFGAKPRPPALLLPALAILMIHPIAGIPAILFLALLALDPARAAGRLHRPATWLFVLSALVGCFALPASFLLNSWRSTHTLGLSADAFSWQTIVSNLHLDVFLANRFNPLLDLVYLVAGNALLFLVFFAIIGWWIGVKKQILATKTLVVFAAMLFTNYLLLTSAVDFSFLIDYERGNYAQRLLPLIAFTLSPLALLAILRAWDALTVRPVSLRMGFCLLLTALIPSSTYFAYPRNDGYEASHGYNVSQSDIDAVHSIEEDAGGVSYAVLANQSVSAAAIRELGFVRYFGDQFYYPIPTGGTFYKKFLSMNEHPTRETAAASLSLVNAHCNSDPECTLPFATTLYYVVDSYWWESARIVETTKGIADDWWALGDGQVHVFRFDINM
jgi:hypothetical protein